jgi:hypothetical protein
MWQDTKPACTRTYHSENTILVWGENVFDPPRKVDVITGTVDVEKYSRRRRITSLFGFATSFFKRTLFEFVREDLVGVVPNRKRFGLGQG